MWQSFHFDENTETLDSYVTCIRQVTTLLGYGEPQILEVLKTPFLQILLVSVPHRRFKARSRDN